MSNSETYLGLLEEEEGKLRWLIQRHPGAVELRYYLVFLLAAHGRSAEVSQECAEILAIYPQNLMAREWTKALRQEQTTARRRRPLVPWQEAVRQSTWSHTRS